MELSLLEWLAVATFVALLVLNAVVGWRARRARRLGRAPEHSDWPEAVEVLRREPVPARASLRR